MSKRLFNPPSLIHYKHLHFMIMDAPSDANLDLYLQEMRAHGVKWCVRVCEPTYSKQRVEDDGVAVYDWVFPDGDAPPEQVIRDWLALVNRVFEPADPSASASNLSDSSAADTKKCIATHCVAGLGRAPVLVAIALIEAGMSPLDAVTFIRERRRGAINSKQLRFLEQYKRRRRADRCSIM